MSSKALQAYKSKIDSTGVDLSKSFYLNKYYTKNHKAISGSSRKDFADCELIYEDSRALRRASKHLSGYKYNEEDSEENIQSSILAFQETYNNAISSASGVDDRQVRKYMKQLETLIGEHKEDLEDIGITIDSKTKKMTVNEELLKNVDIEDIKKAFSTEESNLLQKTAHLSKRINTCANEYLYAQMTGAGLKLNITL